MDPYNYGLRPPHGQSPLSPETPTSASYKTNVKRTKTKKWVEAKAQNYDGDDWGNDFDDEPDEPVPVPPLRPSPGFRQSSPSQATTANLPSNQPPTPHSASASTIRPSQLSGNEQGLSMSSRATAGLPPLQIHVQPQSAPSDTLPPVSTDKPTIGPASSSIDSASEKGAYALPVSPQSVTVGQASVLHTGCEDTPQGRSSESDGRRTSPASVQSLAQPQATRFPPRKSSMGQNDADRPGNSRSSSANAQPNSRSSPSHPPWVDQRSASPSAARSPPTPSNGTSLPLVRPSDIYRRFGDEKDKERGSMESGRPISDSGGGFSAGRSVSPSKPSIPSVESSGQVRQDGSAEEMTPNQGNQRPSLEPVAERKSEYGFDGLLAQPQGRLRTSAEGDPQPAGLAEPREPHPQLPSTEEAEQQRRYSSSPRLPDLARMSLFGDDFFSNPGKFASDAPPMPSFKQQLSPEEATLSPADAKPTLSTLGSTPQQTESLQMPDQDKNSASVVPSPTPSANGSADPAEPRLGHGPLRPSIPGGWVTETYSAGDEQMPAKKGAGVDSGEVSPISDNEDDELRDHSSTMAKEETSSPPSIPNVTDHAALAQQHVNKDDGKAGTDIKPLTPLNPQPSDGSPAEFVAPEKLQRELTMSTITSPSPVKESDKLREEIMRSLSPVRPTSDSNGFNKDSSNNRLTPAQVGEDNGPRESTYLHGVYDDYWAAGDDKPDLPNMPSQHTEQRTTHAAGKDVSDVAPLSPRKETTATPPVLGRRFSWEADSGQTVPRPKETPPDSPPGLNLQAVTASAVSPSSQTYDNHHAETVSSEVARDTEQSLPPATDGTHVGVPPDSGGMSHQVSQVSSVPRDRLDSEVIEPPSPVSIATDKNIASTAPPRRWSLAEEKSMVGVSSNPVSPSPPPGNHPALAQSSEAASPPASSPTPSPALSSQQQQPSTPSKIANFREIMELPSPTERINKYNETRAQFAAMDSGLNNWLVTLKSQHPEHANASASFASNAQNLGQPQSSPTASQPTSQQPYYQQYLNASSSNVNVVPLGRPPVASTPLGPSSHSPSSDFKHSSGQVGAKGKELLLAAGKAGKGLLSKGKNKLRGTGDKSDSSPPPAQSQSKARAERRTSWGIGLGTRSPSQADNSHARSHSTSFSGPLPGPAPNSQTIPEHPATPTPPPQLPPFDSLTRDKHTSAWAPQRPQTPKQLTGPLPDSESEPVSPVSEAQSTSAPTHKDKAGNENIEGGKSELQVPRPSSKTQPSWDPFTGTSPAEEVSEIGKSRNPSPQTHHNSHAGPAANASIGLAAKNDLADDDWVVISPYSPPSGQTYVVSPESPAQARAFHPTDIGRNNSLAEGGPANGRSQAQQQVVELAARQQLPSQQQPQVPHASPTRQSSFVGLPPIRRSSTFGVNLTRRAKKRFSLDEDEDGEGNVLVSSPVVDNTANRLEQTDVARLAHDRQDEHQHPNQSAQPARIETGLSAVRKDSNLSHQVISATSTQAATLATESTGMDWRVDDEKRPLDARAAFRPGGPPPPIDTQLAVKNEGRAGGQPFGPAMRSQQGMTSPTFAGNPIHHLPPQGPWKLEESHLSEPLAASRNRQSGGSASPYQPSFGFEKETGLPSPAVPRPETQLPPRQKFSEVPPSSAQRYPSLFTAPPQGYPNPSSPTGPRTSYDLGHQAYIPSLHRTQTGDSEVSSMDPSGEDDPVRNKRGSGFLKEIGGRFSRNSSRERQNLKMETEPTGHPATTDWRSDGVSEASVAAGDVQDPHKRRSSFFLTLGGSRASESGQPQNRDGDVATSSPKTSPYLGDSLEAQQPAGSADRKRSFLDPDVGNDFSAAVPNPSRSSTSTAGLEQAGTTKGPPKKRFSGFAGKMFSRTSSQQDLQPPPKPTTSHSVASSLQSHHSAAPGGQPGTLAPLPTQGRERSNTTGSGPYSLHPGNRYLQTVGEEERGRRSSAGGFLSGLFGHRSAHKNQEAQEPIQPSAHQTPRAHLQPRPQQPPMHQNVLLQPDPSSHVGKSHIDSTPQQSDHSGEPESPTFAHLVQSQSPEFQLQRGQSDRALLPASQPSQLSEPCSSTQVNQIQATPATSLVRGMGSVNQESAATGPGAPEVRHSQTLSNHPPSQTSMLGQETDRSAIKQVRDHSHEQAQPRQQQQAQINGAQQSPVRLETLVQLSGPQTPPPSQPGSNSNAQPKGIQISPGDKVSSHSTSKQDSSGARAQSPNEVARQSDASQLSYTSAAPPPLPQGAARSVDTEDLRLPKQLSLSVSGLTPEGSQQGVPIPAPENYGKRYEIPPQPNQRSSLPYFPGQDSQPAVQGSTEQGPQLSVSKWFKNRASAQAIQPQSHQGISKESTAKSLFNAFKRSSKQPEFRTQPKPQPSHGQHPQSYQTRQGQQGIPPPGPLVHRGPHSAQVSQSTHQQRRQSPSSVGSYGQVPPHQHTLSNASSEISQLTSHAPQRRSPGEHVTNRVDGIAGAYPGMSEPEIFREPRYDHVPIPRGYAAVHGEGGTAPSPYDIGRPSPPAQYPLHQIPPVHTQNSWGQPSMAPRHPSDASLYSQSQPQSLQAQGHHKIHPAPSQTERRISEASHQPNVSHVNSGPQPGSVGQNSTIQSYYPQYQHQELTGMRPTNGGDSAYGPANLQTNPQAVPPVEPQIHPRLQLRINHQGNQVNNPTTPQGQPTANGAVQNLPPPSQIQPSLDEHKLSVNSPPVEDVRHERKQITALDASTSTDTRKTPLQALTLDTEKAAGSNSCGLPLSRHAGMDRGTTPGASAPAAAPAQQLSVNVQTANRDVTISDDIYDSTPRLVSDSSPPPAQPVTETRTGESRVSQSSADEAPRNATRANGNVNGDQTMLTRGKSTRAELEDTEDERMRTIRLEAQEEKILVDPYDEIHAGKKYKKEDEPDMPQMSATSYPGQEWNPYGAGGYEDWD